MQLYANGSVGLGTGLSAAYVQQVLHTMPVSGLPKTITEFGVQDTATNASDAKQFVNHSLRMAFGDPDMTTFM